MKFGSSGASCVSTRGGSARPRSPARSRRAAPQRLAVRSEHAAADDDPLRRAAPRVLTGEVVVERAERPSPYSGPVELRQRVRDQHERLLRMPQPRPDVVGVVVWRIDVHRSLSTTSRERRCFDAMLVLQLDVKCASVTACTSSSVRRRGALSGAARLPHPEHSALGHDDVDGARARSRDTCTRGRPSAPHRRGRQSSSR